MSNLKVNSINDASGGSTAVLYGVAAPTNSMGFRNRIINGDMRIDQRNAGAAVTTNAAYPLDRFVVAINSGSQSVQRSTVVPTGFVNSLAWTVTTGGAPSSGTQNSIRQAIEGFNVADLDFGLSTAATVTLSFWVRSSVTGTFSGSVMNGAYNRSYVYTYTISSANTWEYKTVTIAGDTSGTWAKDNTAGMRVNFDTGSGSNYNGTAGAWSAGEYYRASGANSIAGTTGATFYITGVQLEAGSVASPFERRDYGRELAMCQRYYRKSFNQATAPAQNAGLVGAVFFKSAASGSGPYGHVSFGTTMRTTPATITTYNPSAANANWRNTTAGSDLNAEVANAGESGVGIGSNTQTMNQYALASIHYTADAEL